MKNYIDPVYEETALKSLKSEMISNHVKTLRMFGVVGMSSNSEYSRTKNFLLDVGMILIEYNDKKKFIWMPHVEEGVMLMVSGLSKYS